jgi:hypothetical protein
MGNWLDRELARQVHAKFEDMVQSFPVPTHAQRTAYDMMIQSYPMRSLLGRGVSGDEGFCGSVAPWMTSGAGCGDHMVKDLFQNLTSPPPSFSSMTGGTLDDFILRRRSPETFGGGMQNKNFSHKPSSSPARGDSKDGDDDDDAVAMKVAGSCGLVLDLDESPVIALYHLSGAKLEALVKHHTGKDVSLCKMSRYNLAKLLPPDVLREAMRREALVDTTKCKRKRKDKGMDAGGDDE